MACISGRVMQAVTQSNVNGRHIHALCKLRGHDMHRVTLSRSAARKKRNAQSPAQRSADLDVFRSALWHALHQRLNAILRPEPKGRP